MSEEDLIEEHRQMEAAQHFIRQFVRIGEKSFPYIWRLGDGQGGWILGEIQDEARRRGVIP